MVFFCIQAATAVRTPNIYVNEVFVILGCVNGAGEFATDVSKQRVSPIFKGLATQDLDCVTLEDLIDTLSRNVDNKLPPYAAQYSRKERDLN